LIGLVRGSPHLIVAVWLFDFVYKEGESLFRERKEKGNSLDVVQVVTFFLHKGKGPEGPRIHFIKRGRYIIKLQPFSSKALGNLLSADKAKLFTNSTLEQKDEKQLGPRTPPPPLAGVLEA
jgi:hypothetical protein